LEKTHQRFPLFLVLEQQNFIQRLCSGIFFGALSYFSLMSWMAPVHLGGYVQLVFVLMLQPILFCGFFKKKSLNIFYIPAAWVFTEFVRSHFMGGFTWPVGNTQAFMPEMIQIANMMGVYGVSFSIIFVNGGLYQVLRKRKMKVIHVAMYLLVICAMSILGTISMTTIGQGENAQLTICTIQPNISIADKSNSNLIDQIMDQHIMLSRQCLSNGKPDLIIWPETAVTDDVLKDQILNKKITDLVRQIQTPVLLGSAMLVDQQNFNSAVLFDQHGNVRGIYHKQQLIPWTERVFSFGKGIGLFRLGKGKVLGVTICSEDGYPRIFRKLRKKDPQLVAVLLNDAWFKQKAAYMIHLQNSIMRAVEFGVPVARSANSGWSGFIDAVGRAEGIGKNLDRAQVFKKSIRVSQRKTFYARWGDIFAILCGVFVILSQWKEN